MKRSLFLIAALFVVLAEALAQQYNVYVRNDKGEPLERVIVYTFFKQADGKAAYKEGMAKKDEGYFFDTKQFRVYAQGRTESDGLCVIEGSKIGSIILDGGDCMTGEYDFKLYHVSDYIKDDLNRNIELVLTGKEYNKERSKTRVISADQAGGEFAGGGGVEDLPELVKRASPTMDQAGGGVERHGKNNILIKRELDIDGDYARGDARFVAFPTVVFHDYKDSVNHMPPTVVDGADYARNMVRRSGFDTSHDVLNEFKYDASTHLEDHQSERIVYAQWAKIVKGTSYHIPGVLWYEDFNGVYHEDSLMFSDGKEREPMRFLNWEAARQFAAIDTAYYRKRGTVEAVGESKDFKLTFEQGREQLNLNDTVTREQRDLMLEWLNKYYTNRDAQITKVTVRAYSSPEGSEARNRVLSRARANTIQQMLKARFGNVNIVPEFDDFDNIVPWSTIADSMSMMTDTIAKSYAERVRAIVMANTGFDNQFRAIRAQSDLYDYISKNVLDRVRIVSVEAEIIAQTILNKDQILEKYNTEKDFVERMMPYQYYVMMCHLADEQRWDELYNVSKIAYERNNKERRLQKQLLKPGSETELTYVSTAVPYPLAGYYYAVSSMRKGIVDTEILKPYLDDGRAGNRPVLNNLAFVVAQVLMFCQDEAFDGANELIRKYNLMKFDELTGLIMFVRCLDGQYADSEDVRQYVMGTSEMNRAVILTALGKFEEALAILYGKNFTEPDAKVEYLKAICHFRMQNSKTTSFDADGFPATVLYDEEAMENEGATPYSLDASMWAVPMLNSIKLEPSYADYLRNDGYFNNAYRQMVLYAWKRMQSGVEMQAIAQEYGALVSKMRKDLKTLKK